MEQKTQCPLCLGLHDNCFVEKTEVDGKPFESYMCFQCGMTTNSHFALDSEHLEKSTENNTQLMNDLKVIDDDRGLVWFPSVVNMGEKGIIYPEGVLTDWYWYYAKVVNIPKDEQGDYEGHERRLAVESAEKFGQFEFTDACIAMGIIKDNG